MRRTEWLARLNLLAVCLGGTVGQAEITATVNSDRINVRAQPTIFSEVICQLRQGAHITILESIKLQKPRGGEPAEWLRIALSTNSPVWVNARYIDPTQTRVQAQRLNLRAGPGENYSILGQLKRGETVTVRRVVDDWMEIDGTPGATAFIAAPFLTYEGTPPSAAAGAVATPATPSAPAPTSTPVTLGGPEPLSTGVAPSGAAPAPAPARVDTRSPVPPPAPKSPPPTAPLTSAAAAPLLPQAVAVAPDPTPAPAPQPKPTAAPPPTPDEPVEADAPPPPPRLVHREGIVVPTPSIQAPTSFQLRSTDTKRPLNFLLPANPSVLIAPFLWQRVVVRGEEQIEPRWPRTPMIEVQTIRLAP